MIDDPSRDDPFAPSSDPYLESRSRGENESEHRLVEERLDAATISRRGVLVGLSVLSVAGVVQACVPRRLGCLPEPPIPQTCQHRFCRYYKG